MDVDGTQLWRKREPVGGNTFRAHFSIPSAFPLPLVPIPSIAEMSLESIPLSVMQHWTDTTPRPSAPTPGQDTELPDTETPAKYWRGSFDYDQVNGILPLEWPNLEAFDMWRWNEELAHSIELIKSTINACGSQVWTLRRIFMCSREDGRGHSKYVKKHLEQKQKIPSKKTGCLCNIVIKSYLNTERILGCYESEHNHPIGIANVLFMCLSARAWRRMRDLVSQK